MTIERLRETINQVPFEPFIIHLADGRQVPVQHRELIIASPSGRTIVVVQPDDSLNIIDLLLVTDLDMKRGRNGSAGKPRRPRR